MLKRGKVKLGVISGRNRSLQVSMSLAGGERAVHMVRVLVGVSAASLLAGMRLEFACFVYNA